MAETTARTVLDERTIRSLAKMPKITKDFPVFKEALKTGAACCKKRAALTNEALQAMERVKRAIASLPADKQQRLRFLLNTHEVSVSYKEGGKTVTKRF